MSDFDYTKYLMNIKGKDYLPVASRILWLRKDRPLWSIETEPLQINIEKQYAIFQATIRDEAGRIMAQATKMEDVRGFQDFLEKAETGAIGRALGFCGFGTQFCGEDIAEPIPAGAAAEEAPRRLSPSSPQGAPATAKAAVAKTAGTKTAGTKTPAAEIKAAWQAKKDFAERAQSIGYDLCEEGKDRPSDRLTIALFYRLMPNYEGEPLHDAEAWRIAQERLIAPNTPEPDEGQLLSVPGNERRTTNAIAEGY